MFIKLFCLLILSLLSISSFADVKNKTGTDGCGLGWQVTEKKTLSATTTRGTTNSVLPPTYSMTSGTSGCDSHGFISKNRESQHFAEVNFEVIIADIATGAGEHLSTYIQTLGCSDSKMVINEFKNNYDGILNTNNGAELQQQVKSIIHNNFILSNSCINA